MGPFPAFATKLLGYLPGVLERLTLKRVFFISGVMFVALAPVLVPAAIWIYTLVFAFAALWFAHFALAALEALRAEREPAPVVPPAPPPFPTLEMQPPP